jgi:hypothetical protein
LYSKISPTKRAAAVMPLPHHRQTDEEHGKGLSRVSSASESAPTDIGAGRSSVQDTACRNRRIEVTAVAKSLGSDESAILDLLESLDFLYDRCREWETGDENFAPPLRSFLRGTRLWGALGPDAEASFDRLIELLQPNPALEQLRKLRWLRTGILETAVEFASFVDLRPDFSKDRSEVRGLVPVVLLRVRTESDLERDRSHVFQLTLDGVRKLRKVLEDIDQKLHAISQSGEFERLMRKDGDEVGGGNGV